MHCDTFPLESKIVQNLFPVFLDNVSAVYELNEAWLIQNWKDYNWENLTNIGPNNGFYICFYK